MTKKNLHDTARPLLKLAFAEDLGHRGDITTLALGSPTRSGHAVIFAKQDGVVAGLEIVKLVFHEIDPSINIQISVSDGDAVHAQQSLVRLYGSSEKILSAERTALNFLGRLSGIATLTRQFVEAVVGLRAKILDTRKTTPGWRLLEKYAVTCGGGENHRMGLYDMFLIKENHIVVAGGMGKAVQRCRDFMEAGKFLAAIEVETQNLDDVKQAVALHVDRILLDNMQLEQMRECVSYVDGRIPIEASGNVSLVTVRSIAETGVDYISVGSLTHSAKSFDVSLLFQ